MVPALKNDEYSLELISNKRHLIIFPKNANELEKEIDELICVKKLFKRFSINTTFLNEYPLNWESIEDYHKTLLIIKNIPVISKAIERRGKLIEGCNNKITKDEYQK